MERALDEVRAQLGRLLASPQFARSERLATFLRYIVERAAEGRLEELKETIIGMEVFGRAPGYDPKVDPIVRVQAARLREKLRDYYSVDRHGELLIEVPKGSYSPRWRALEEKPAGRGRFRWLIAASAAASCVLGLAGWLSWRAISSPLESTRPLSVAVLPFVNLSPDVSNEYFSDGLTEEIINALTKVEGLRVPARASAFSFKGKGGDIREIGSKLQVEMVLEGTVRKEGEKVRITAALSKVADGYHVWSASFDRDMKGVLAIQNEIARAIVAALPVNLASSNTTGRSHL